MSVLDDYLQSCWDTGTKVNILVEGQPPNFIEGEIDSFNQEYLWLKPDKKIRINDIVGFPEKDI